MKFRTNLFLLIALIALAVTSCTKTEVYNDELKTDVVFKPMIQDNTTFKSFINRDSLGASNDIIAHSIQELDIVATHLNSGYSVSDNFIVVDNGDHGVAKLNGVVVGENRFDVSTESYINQTFNRFSFGNQISNNSPFNTKPINNTEDLVYCMRLVSPFVEFEGTTVQNVTYNDCATDCNEVEIDMNAKQGRWICTVEFENPDLLDNFKASVKVNNNIPNTNQTSGTTWVTDQHQFAWFYISHEDANEGTDISIDIGLKGNRNGGNINEWTLSYTDDGNNTNDDDIAIKAGIDRWIKIVIKESSIKTSCTNFSFNWEWSTETTDIDLQ